MLFRYLLHHLCRRRKEDRSVKLWGIDTAQMSKYADDLLKSSSHSMTPMIPIKPTRRDSVTLVFRCASHLNGIEISCTGDLQIPPLFRIRCCFSLKTWHNFWTVVSLANLGNHQHTRNLHGKIANDCCGQVTGNIVLNFFEPLLTVFPF